MLAILGRLADVLRYLSDDGLWEEVGARLGRRLIVVYDLGREAVRLDSAAVAVYHDPEGNVLFRYGHSKDHRLDLAQFKVVLAILGRLVVMLALLVVGGDEADGGLYVPAILRARSVVCHGGVCVAGEMAAAGCTCFHARKDRSRPSMRMLTMRVFVCRRDADIRCARLGRRTHFLTALMLRRRSQACTAPDVVDGLAGHLCEA